VFRRLRDSIEISWQDEPLAGAPPGFHFSAASGISLLEPEAVARPLRDVVLAAVNYLLQIQPGSKRLVELRAALQALESPREHEERLGWLAGLHAEPSLSGRLIDSSIRQGRTDLWSSVVNALTERGNEKAAAAALEVDESALVVTGSCQAALLFGAVAPSVSEEDIRALAGVLVDQYASSDMETPRLRELTLARPLDPALAAWEQGYDLAETLHEELQLNNEWVDIVQLLQDLGITRLDFRLSDKAIRGCSVVGPHHRPTIMVNKASPFSTTDPALRFTLTHELCHILYDRKYGQRLAIASGPWAPRALERRAKAFAAMFLMPPRLVERAIADLPDPITELRDIETVAQRLHVSRRATVDHLYNLTLMSEGDRDAVLRRLEVLPDSG